MLAPRSMGIAQLAVRFGRGRGGGGAAPTRGCWSRCSSLAHVSLSTAAAQSRVAIQQTALRVTPTASFSTSPSTPDEQRKSSGCSEEQVLLGRLKDELTSAMKARHREAVDVLKPLLSEYQLASKVSHSENIVSLLSLLRKAIARRVEAAHHFTSAKRGDLAEKETWQRGFLQQFLPPRMTEEQLASLAQQALQSAKAQGGEGKKLLGLAIKELKEKLGDKVEGSRLKEAVEKAINSAEGK